MALNWTQSRGQLTSRATTGPVCFIDHLEASVKQTITLLADDGTPYVKQYSSQNSGTRFSYNQLQRTRTTPGELNTSTYTRGVAREYLTLAPASPDFKHGAQQSPH